MGERFHYWVFDLKRNRECFEFDAIGDEVAKREFGAFYRERVGMAKWENRRFGRYFLLRTARYVDGRRVMLDEPVAVMVDDEVRLNFDHWFMADPPGSEAEYAEDVAEFERLDALDAARLARRGNQAA